MKSLLLFDVINYGIEKDEFNSKDGTEKIVVIYGEFQKDKNDLFFNGMLQ